MDIGDIIGVIAIVVATGGVMYAVRLNRPTGKLELGNDIRAIKEGIQQLQDEQKRIEQRADARINNMPDDPIDFRTTASIIFATKSGADLIISNSPPALSDEGEQVAQKSQINQFITKHQQRYFEELDQTWGDADLYKTCIHIATRELRERNADIVFIQDYFYNAGISLYIEQIFALKLRNIYQQQKAKKTA